MFFMVGWEKELKKVGPGLRVYCYHCQKRREWDHWRETEWARLFMVRMVPFLWKNFLVCPGCRDTVKLDSTTSGLLRSPGRHDELARRIEQRQLATKTEVQKRFLASQRERYENGRDTDAP